MRIMMQISIPNDPFNTLVRNGTASATMGKVLEAIKPEASYFTAINGKRTAFLIVNLENASQIPALAEPAFLKLNAEVTMLPVMVAEDLAKADLDKLGKMWS